MKFSLEKSLEILERTPGTLAYLLENISSDWTSYNEGGDTWSVYDVIGHLVHGDRTDWINRTEIILQGKGEGKFAKFDRFAQFEQSKGKALPQLLEEFKTVRKGNIDKLRGLHISEADLAKTGIHPVFGAVSLANLLAAWVAHDLDHIFQITRVMAKQYKDAVGPWVEYMKILNQ